MKMQKNKTNKDTENNTVINQQYMSGKFDHLGRLKRNYDNNIVDGVDRTGQYKDFDGSWKKYSDLKDGIFFTEITQDEVEKVDNNPYDGSTKPVPMTLPGTNKKPFDVFFQFGDDEPVMLCSGIRTNFVIEITADSSLEFCSPPDYEEQTLLVSGRDHRKKFKIFTKTKK